MGRAKHNHKRSKALILKKKAEQTVERKRQRKAKERERLKETGAWQEAARKRRAKKIVEEKKQFEKLKVKSGVMLGTEVQPPIYVAILNERKKIMDEDAKKPPRSGPRGFSREAREELDSEAKLVDEALAIGGLPSSVGRSDLAKKLLSKPKKRQQYLGKAIALESPVAAPVLRDGALQFFRSVGPQLVSGGFAGEADITGFQEQLRKKNREVLREAWRLIVRLLIESLSKPELHSILASKRISRFLRIALLQSYNRPRSQAYDEYMECWRTKECSGSPVSLTAGELTPDQVLPLAAVAKALRRPISITRMQPRVVRTEAGGTKTVWRSVVCWRSDADSRYADC